MTELALISGYIFWASCIAYELIVRALGKRDWTMQPYRIHDK